MSTFWTSSGSTARLPSSPAAGKGIGAAIAAAFADAGADVVVTARTAADVEQVAAASALTGRRALAVPGDVNDFGFLAELVDRTVGELGGLDIVVNNAGGSVSRPVPRHHDRRPRERPSTSTCSAPFELSRLAVPAHAGAGRRLDRQHRLGRRAEGDRGGR